MRSCAPGSCLMAKGPGGLTLCTVPVTWGYTVPGWGSSSLPSVITSSSKQGSWGGILPFPSSHLPPSPGISCYPCSEERGAMCSHTLSQGHPLREPSPSQGTRPVSEGAGKDWTSCFSAPSALSVPQKLPWKKTPRTERADFLFKTQAGGNYRIQSDEL